MQKLKYLIINRTYEKMLSGIDKKWNKTPYLDRETPNKYLKALNSEQSMKNDKIEGLYLTLKKGKLEPFKPNCIRIGTEIANAKEGGEMKLPNIPS